MYFVDDGKMPVAQGDDVAVKNRRLYDFDGEHFILTLPQKCVTQQDQAPEPFELEGVTPKCITGTKSKNIADGVVKSITHTIRLNVMDSVVQHVSKHTIELSGSTLRQNQENGGSYDPPAKRSNA